MKTFTGIAEVAAAVGQDLGTSDWLLIDQARIDAFADATEDHQWIHVDPERAAAGPFGTTIAHGYLTLSLLSGFYEQIYTVEGISMAINYGLGKVRFPSPVPSGSRVRGATRLIKVTEVAGGIQCTFETVVSIEGQEKPACVAESIARFIA